ncbi:MAG TPA: nucleotidyl transferase AbiEii/AbiGii toxin family protein [Thermoanaerobaculia bacterium]|nr:nucleotidyl transferase AbiEii/AbiGii toxin family protein [Thermoanaerobaculia bacterium]
MIDLTEVRRIAITAMFADDFLLDRVVLKGGNALSLVYGVGTRTSLDLDFSIEADFPDPIDARERIFRSLRARFDSAGYVVFDETFGPRPAVAKAAQSPRWGGYRVEFKLINRELFDRLHRDVDALRRRSLVIGPAQMRIFTIDLSRYEYCEPKREFELDDFIIYVYTPEMIAVEKVRAICQQMPEYELNAHHHPRARDFYDIALVIEECSASFAPPEIHQLVRDIFAAKEVPLSLIGRIDMHREFHRADWPKVELAVAQRLLVFDDYFDFVVAETAKLQPLWVE